MSHGTAKITGPAPDGAGAALEDRSEARDRRRWLILAVVALAQLMVVLDATIVNIALPSAQRALHFSNTDRQWVITAYALAFGSLLLLGGRLADLLGRKAMFLAGLAGFAVASAVGGAATSFAMLVAARACQGAFGALLAPAALSLLVTTFTGSKDRGKAFGVFGAIAGAGGGIGLLLGGLLTQYASWRACLDVNLVFAAIAGTGAVLLLRQQRDRQQRGLDLPGVLAEGGAMFCIVYGFSNAATHSWQSPDTWGFLAAGSAGLAAFAWWQTRAAYPLLPLRIDRDRDRAAAYLSILIAGWNSPPVRLTGICRPCSPGAWPDSSPPRHATRPPVIVRMRGEGTSSRTTAMEASAAPPLAQPGAFLAARRTHIAAGPGHGCGTGARAYAASRRRTIA
jgi:MFS family permease